MKYFYFCKQNHIIYEGKETTLDPTTQRNVDTQQMTSFSLIFCFAILPHSLVMAKPCFSFNILMKGSFSLNLARHCYKVFQRYIHTRSKKYFVKNRTKTEQNQKKAWPYGKLTWNNLHTRIIMCTFYYNISNCGGFITYKAVVIYMARHTAYARINTLYFSLYMFCVVRYSTIIIVI